MLDLGWDESSVALKKDDDIDDGRSLDVLFFPGWI